MADEEKDFKNPEENGGEVTETQNEGGEDEGNPPEIDDNAPEEYDFSGIELPEGYKLDEEITDEFKKAAKEMNLSQAKADKYVNMGLKLSQKIQTKFENALVEAQKAKFEEYEQLLKDDKEIGGNKLEAALRDANVAYEKFVPDNAAKLLAETGLNKHPEIVKVFMNIGKQIKEDTVKGQGDSRKEHTAADWYPTMQKQ